MDQVYHNNI